MMARISAPLACLGLIMLSRAPAMADEQAEARAIIDKAIEFAGGRDALARYSKPFVCMQEGTAMGGNGASAFKRKVTTHFPDKWRSDQTGDAGAMAFALNGEKGWNKTRGPGIGAPGPLKVQQMNEAQVKGARERVYAQWLTTLLPLDDEVFHLSKSEEITIDKRAAVGVTISREGRPDIQLYFDKETYAPVKLARKMNGLPYEEFYDDYAELDGLVYPKKTVVYGNGQKLFEAQTTDLKFLDKVEESTFDQP